MTIGCDPEPCKTVITYTESDTTRIRANQSIVSYYDHEIIGISFPSDTIKWAGEKDEIVYKFKFSFNEEPVIINEADSLELGIIEAGENYNHIRVHCLNIDSAGNYADIVIRNSVFMTDCSNW